MLPQPASSLATGGTVTVNGGATVNGGIGGFGGPGMSGAVGPDGDSAAGITGANLTVVNAGGNIGGGLNSNGTRANAVTFTGGANVYETWNGASLSGNVVDMTNNGTFRVGGPASYLLGVGDLTAVGGSGQYQGFKHLEKVGDGTWILDGSTTVIEDIIVKSGHLQVNASLGSVAQTTVNAGTKLDGIGVLGAVDVKAGGMIWGGDVGPGTSLTVASLAMQSGAIYLTWLTPSQSTSINVTGTASIGGAKVQAYFFGGSYAETRYTVMKAGSISGAFDPAVITLGLPSGFKTSLPAMDATRTEVYLDLALNILPPSTNGLNRNQTNVATAITNFFNAGNSIPIAFGNLTPNGLTQVSGELGTGSQQTAFQAMNLFMGLISDPFSAGRGVVNNGPTGYADDSESMAYAGRAKSKNPNDAFAAFTKGAALLCSRSAGTCGPRATAVRRPPTAMLLSVRTTRAAASTVV